MESMFLDALRKLLDDHCTPAVVRGIESGGAPESLWQAIEASGFLDLMVAEQEGGAGLTLPELFPLACELGRHAVPLPVAQTIVARAFLGARRANGRIGLAPGLRQAGEGRWTAAQVPAGMWLDQVLLQDGAAWRLCGIEGAQREAIGVHASGMANLQWSHRPQGDALSSPPGDLLPLAALLVAAQMCGAMDRVLEMTLGYCNDRVQFGRPIGKFQAVQHQLSVMAEHVVAAHIATEAAFSSGRQMPALAAAAIAKARASEAAPLVAATAHALHGAIGVTDEYDLQLFTRLLHEGRVACGSEVYWHRVVGECVIAGAEPVADFVQGL